MSSQALGWAWNQAIPDLPALPPTGEGNRRPRAAKSTLKAVLLAMAEHATPEGRCFPSWSRIAAMTGKSRASVARAVRDLEEAGLVCRRRRRRENGGLTSCEYALPLGEDPPSHSETTPVSPRDLPPSHSETSPRLTVRPQEPPRKNPTKTTTPLPPSEKRSAPAGDGGGGEKTKPRRGHPGIRAFSADNAQRALAQTLRPDGVDEACIAEALRQVEDRLAAGGEAITSPLRLAEELARSAHRERLQRRRDEKQRERWEQARGAEVPEQPCPHGMPPGEPCDACREEGAALRAGGWREVLASSRPRETSLTGQGHP